METSRSVNEIPTLPLDVIETIIAVLATVDDQDLSTVKTCSLTCRSFLHLCRKHIFASISLDVFGASESPFPTSPRFLKLLGSAPEIVHFVRKLSVEVLGDKSVTEIESKKFFDLAEALKRFTRIEHLTIASYQQSCLRDGIVQDWPNVAECIQDAVLHLLMLPTLRDLKLSGLFHFPILELARCTHLRGLCTETFRDPVYDQSSLTLHPRSLVLEEYDLERRSSQAMEKLMMFEWPNGQPFLDFSHLVRFSARRDRTDHKAMELAHQILQRTDQIDHIVLAIDSAMKPSVLFATICHSLKTLRRIHLYCYLGYTWDILIEVSRQLRLIQNWPNVLEELMVGVSPPPGTFGMATDSAWGMLDEALQGSGWSSLKSVEISIQMPKNIANLYLKEGGADFESAIRNMPQTHFPFLSSSKAITFSFETPFLAYK